MFLYKIDGVKEQLNIYKNLKKDDLISFEYNKNYNDDDDKYIQIKGCFVSYTEVTENDDEIKNRRNLLNDMYKDDLKTHNIQLQKYYNDVITHEPEPEEPVNYETVDEFLISHPSIELMLDNDVYNVYNVNLISGLKKIEKGGKKYSRRIKKAKTAKKAKKAKKSAKKTKRHR